MSTSDHNSADAAPDYPVHASDVLDGVQLLTRKARRHGRTSRPSTASALVRHFGQAHTPAGTTASIGLATAVAASTPAPPTRTHQPRKTIVVAGAIVLTAFALASLLRRR